MKDLGGRVDFHIHSLLSDGVLLPSEIVRRAEALGYVAIAITDHVDSSNIESVTTKIVKASEELKKYAVKTLLIPGVELTHVPPRSIEKLASKAKKLGAKLIIVHGETIVEPVTASTNRAAVKCSDVNILAHPGLITLEETEAARSNGIYLELTSRVGHCLTNGHVAKTALEGRAEMIVNSDLHEPKDFISQETANKIALGAGLPEKVAVKTVSENPKNILKNLGLI
jgi:histidinol phosphatase-like PHP family hydrolase